MNRFEMQSTSPVSDRNARRRTASSVRLCLGALCLLPLAAVAAQNNGPTLLRMKFRQGEVSKYQATMNMTMRMTMTMPGGQPQTGPGAQPMTIPVNMNMLIQQQVTKVLPNGNGVVTSTVLNHQMSMNGQARPNAPNMPPSTMTMTPMGKIVSTSGMPQGNPMNGMIGPNSLSGMGVVYLPSKPVRPGDSWTDTVRVPGMVGAGSGTAKSHFLRYETVGHYRTALIRTVLTVPLNMTTNMMGQPSGRSGGGAMTMTGSMHMTSDTNFAVAEGKIIRTTGNGAASMVMRFPHTNRPAQPGMGTMPQSTKMNMTLTISMALAQ